MAAAVPVGCITFRCLAAGSPPALPVVHRHDAARLDCSGLYQRMARRPRPLAGSNQVLADRAGDAAGLGHLRSVFERSGNPQLVAIAGPSAGLALAGCGFIVHAGISASSVRPGAHVRRSLPVACPAKLRLDVYRERHREIWLQLAVCRGPGGTGLARISAGAPSVQILTAGGKFVGLAAVGALACTAGFRGLGGEFFDSLPGNPRHFSDPSHYSHYLDLQP